MPRHKRCRRVAGPPRCCMFKPAGMPASSMAQVVLTVDELEAIRLADLLGMYQEQAAEQMDISRQTFGRIVESARRKVAEVLVSGRTLRIEGGEIEMPQTRGFRCRQCQHVWELAFGTCRPQECPECKSVDIHRAEEGRGRRGRCCRRREQGRGRQAPAGLEQKGSP